MGAALTPSLVAQPCEKSLCTRSSSAADSPLTAFPARKGLPAASCGESARSPRLPVWTAMLSFPKSVPLVTELTEGI